MRGEAVLPVPRVALVGECSLTCRRLQTSRKGSDLEKTSTLRSPWPVSEMVMTSREAASCSTVTTA